MTTTMKFGLPERMTEWALLYARDQLKYTQDILECHVCNGYIKAADLSAGMHILHTGCIDKEAVGKPLTEVQIPKGSWIKDWLLITIKGSAELNLEDETNPEYIDSLKEDISNSEEVLNRIGQGDKTFLLNSDLVLWLHCELLMERDEIIYSLLEGEQDKKQVDYWREQLEVVDYYLRMLSPYVVENFDNNKLNLPILTYEERSGKVPDIDLEEEEEGDEDMI